MSIQMSLVFVLLIFEVGLVSFLLLPFPPKIQNLLLKQYNSLVSNSNFRIILGFIDCLVGIMFVDSFKTGFGFAKPDEIIEFNKLNNNNQSPQSGNVWDNRAKIFYSQRNLYILGAILALQSAVWFMSFLLKSTVKNKTKLSELTKNNNNNSKLNVENDQLSAQLKEQVEKAELDVKTLQKQYDSLYDEYMKKNQAVEEPKAVKKDK